MASCGRYLAGNSRTKTGAAGAVVGIVSLQASTSSSPTPRCHDQPARPEDEP